MCVAFGRTFASPSSLSPLIFVDIHHGGIDRHTSCPFAPLWVSIPPSLCLCSTPLSLSRSPSHPDYQSITHSITHNFLLPLPSPHPSLVAARLSKKRSLTTTYHHHHAPCPVCGKLFTLRRIEQHADRCATQKFLDIPRGSHTNVAPARPSFSRIQAKTTRRGFPMSHAHRLEQNEVRNDSSAVRLRPLSLATPCTSPTVEHHTHPSQTLRYHGWIASRMYHHRQPSVCLPRFPRYVSLPQEDNRERHPSCVHCARRETYCGNHRLQPWSCNTSSAGHFPTAKLYSSGALLSFMPRSVQIPCVYTIGSPGTLWHIGRDAWVAHTRDASAASLST